MPIEIGGSKARPVDFTLEGKGLFVRKLPLRLALKIQSVDDGDVIPAEIVAEFISACVVYDDGGQVWDVDDVLEFDATSMMGLFTEVSGHAVTTEEAGKN